MNRDPSAHDLQPPAPPPQTAAAASALKRWSIGLLLALLVLLSGFLAQHLQVVQTAERLAQEQQRLTELELKGVEQRSEAERLLAARQLADLTAQVGEMRDQLFQAHQQRASLERELASARQELAQQQAELAEAHARLARLELMTTPAETETAADAERAPRPAADPQPPVR